MIRATTIPCPDCGAKAGEACRGLRGRRLAYPHGMRRAAVSIPRRELAQTDLDRQEAACRAFLNNPHVRTDDFWAAVA